MLDRLIALWRRRRAEVAQTWNRTLPFGDYIVDRWEKARLLGFGEGTSVYDNVLVLGDVRVGAHCWIGPNAILDGSGGLTIGDHCCISAGAQLYSHDTVQRTLTGGDAPIDRAATHIGSRVYIGPSVTVAKGVSIGDGCVIGGHSLVLHDVPAGSKAFGVPCRVMGPAVPNGPIGDLSA